MRLICRWYLAITVASRSFYTVFPLWMWNVYLVLGTGTRIGRRSLNVMELVLVRLTCRCLLWLGWTGMTLIALLETWHGPRTTFRRTPWDLMNLVRNCNGRLIWKLLCARRDRNDLDLLLLLSTPPDRFPLKNTLWSIGCTACRFVIGETMWCRMLNRLLSPK